MGPFATGQVVLLPFPFSDLARNKIRPALLVADADRGDWLACQITSNPYADTGAIPLDYRDFQTGGLQRTSYIRPAKLFTAHASLFLGQVGTLQQHHLTRVRNAIIQILTK